MRSSDVVMYLVLSTSPICYITYKYYIFYENRLKEILSIISITFLIIKISFFMNAINRGTSYAKSIHI